jgi:uncharacterized RDD family membrane protein YckC
MKNIKLYTALASIIGIILLYSSTTVVYYIFKSSYFTVTGILSLLLPAIALTALIIAFSSNFKKTALLRLYLCFQVFSSPFHLIFYIGYFARRSDYESYGAASATTIIGVLLALISLICAGILLWHLSREQKPKLTFVQYGEQQYGQFEPASRWLRFANRVIDVAVILYFLYNLLQQRRIVPRVHFSNEYVALLLIEAVAVIGFYLLLEGIFNTTPGKCATNTVIVNAEGNRPNFGQILGRTFCRLIPFEALSFLSSDGRGLHDSLSGTYVVEAAADNAPVEEITLDAELIGQQ